MISRPASDPSRKEPALSLEKLLRSAGRNRVVAPAGQPFAFSTHCGKVRKVNEDTALVSVGRRSVQGAPYLAAVLCDGMGGLEKGDEAAILATATAIAAMVSSEQPLDPRARMDLAIRTANAAVFERFRGSAGAVLVALLIEDRQTVIGWVGDARIYGLVRGGTARPLTRDDTVAAAIADLEGAAPDAMDTLLAAIGQKAEIKHHTVSLDATFQMLVLVSDGVHRIDSSAFDWILRFAHNPFDVVHRLVIASYWEGGRDNATALAVDLEQPLSFDEDSEGFAAWAEVQPRVWRILRSTSPATPSQLPSSQPGRNDQHASDPLRQLATTRATTVPGNDQHDSEPLRQATEPRRKRRRHRSPRVELPERNTPDRDIQQGSRSRFPRDSQQPLTIEYGRIGESTPALATGVQQPLAIDHSQLRKNGTESRPAVVAEAQRPLAIEHSKLRKDDAEAQKSLVIEPEGLRNDDAEPKPAVAADGQPRKEFPEQGLDPVSQSPDVAHPRKDES